MEKSGRLVEEKTGRQVKHRVNAVQSVCEVYSGSRRIG